MIVILKIQKRFLLLSWIFLLIWLVLFLFSLLYLLEYNNIHRYSTPIYPPRNHFRISKRELGMVEIAPHFLMILLMEVVEDIKQVDWSSKSDSAQIMEMI